MIEQPEICCVLLIASPSMEVRRRWKVTLCRKFPTLLATTQKQVERKLAKFNPSILFLDLDLLGNGVRKSLCAMQRLSPATKIVILGSAPNETTEIMALQAGARGYCNRHLVPALMKRAVQMIQKGEFWFTRSIILAFLRKLMNHDEHPRTSRRVLSEKLEALSLRQREVAHRIASGFSNKQIANALNITEATVKAHVTIIFRKLRVSDRLELALFVRDKATNTLHSSITSLEKTN